MSDFLVLGGETKKTLELGGLTFTAAPVTVADWQELTRAAPDEEAAWMVKHLQARLKDGDAAALTPEWYDHAVPYTEHGNVANALLGLLENHPTAKGNTVLRLTAGVSKDTFTIQGVRFMAGVFSRAEAAQYDTNQRARAEQTPLLLSALRRRVHGGSIDPALITPEWYGQAPAPTGQALERILLFGPAMQPPEVPQDAKKKP